MADGLDRQESDSTLRCRLKEPVGRRRRQRSSLARPIWAVLMSEGRSSSLPGAESHWLVYREPSQMMWTPSFMDTRRRDLAVMVSRPVFVELPCGRPAWMRTISVVFGPEVAVPLGSCGFRLAQTSLEGTEQVRRTPLWRTSAGSVASRVVERSLDVVGSG